MSQASDRASGRVGPEDEFPDGFSSSGNGSTHLLLRLTGGG
jgi:hypothetical protein